MCVELSAAPSQGYPEIVQEAHLGTLNNFAREIRKASRRDELSEAH
jgi:hypothetical protein